jgi:hypothetical protein
LDALFRHSNAWSGSASVYIEMVTIVCHKGHGLDVNGFNCLS